MKDNVPTIIAIAIGFVLFCIGGGIGQMFEEKHWRQECLKRNVAEWSVNKQTGEVKWHWLNEESNSSAEKK